MTGLEPATPGATVQCSTIELHPPRVGANLARLEGVEPPTGGLEIRCSIQLSYRRSRKSGGAGAKSGREDLNLRPPAPKAGALPGCATPRCRHRRQVPHFSPLAVAPSIGPFALTER